MSAVGGSILIGVDENATLVGLQDGRRREFDEARLRGRLRKYLPDVEIETAVHAVGEKLCAMIWVEPHPEGYAIFAVDGQYLGTRGQEVPAFRAGDVYLRRGSASVRALPADMARLRRAFAERERAKAAPLSNPTSDEQQVPGPDAAHVATGSLVFRHGPGDRTSRMTISVATMPRQGIALTPSDQLDDLLAIVAVRVLGGGFRADPGPGRSAASRTFHPDFLPDTVTIAPSGLISIQLCAQPPEWSAAGHPDWLLDATQLVSDAALCLLVPLALARETGASSQCARLGRNRVQRMERQNAFVSWAPALGATGAGRHGHCNRPHLRRRSRRAS
jgi:hypothetical protein